MEEAGGTPEPQHDESSTTMGRGLLVVGIVIFVAMVGLVAWVAGGDDVAETVERADERFPPVTTGETVPAPETTAVATVPVTGAPATPPVTVAPSEPPTVPVTVAPITTPPPIAGAPATTTAETVGAPSTPSPLGPSIDELVPSVAAFAERLATADAVRTQITLLLGSPRHDVASPNGVAALCAIVALDGPLAAEGRWERDGRSVSSTDLARHDSPGFGDCVGNGGDMLEDGSYQFIAADAAGAESAAGGFVVGAARVDQRFTNDGDEPVCGVRIAPRTSRYFEAYVFDGRPIAPGDGVTLPVAAVDQDVEVTSCGGGEVLASFDFEPDQSEAQTLRP